MDCTQAREALSARADGELDDAGEREAVQAHLARCAGCAAYAERLARLNRQVRLQAAEEVPDLTQSILARLRPAPTPREAGLGRLRLGLLVLALLQLTLAVTDLLAPGEHVHQIREVAAWQAALGAGFAVVAWRPALVAGLVPVVAAATLTMLVAVGLDVWAGHVSLAEEAQHLVKVVGLVLLWRLQRRTRPTALRPQLAGG